MRCVWKFCTRRPGALAIALHLHNSVRGLNFARVRDVFFACVCVCLVAAAQCSAQAKNPCGGCCSLRTRIWYQHALERACKRARAPRVTTREKTLSCSCDYNRCRQHAATDSYREHHKRHTLIVVVCEHTLLRFRFDVFSISVDDVTTIVPCKKRKKSVNWSLFGIQRRHCHCALCKMMHLWAQRYSRTRDNCACLSIRGEIDKIRDFV